MCLWIQAKPPCALHQACLGTYDVINCAATRGGTHGIAPATCPGLDRDPPVESLEAAVRSLITAVA